MPSKNSLILHPHSGRSHFGELPKMKSQSIVLEPGLIVLKFGKHSGPNHGFGLEHIMAEHQDEIFKKGFSGGAEFVASIIQPKTPVYFEANTIKNTRITICRTSTGIAILQYDGYHQWWSVVTAFGATQANGTRIGAVL